MNHWQYTLRSLLIFTVVVSIAMYFAVTWTPLFLVALFCLTYLFAMFGAFHVTAEKCSHGASVVWLLCGALLVFIAATNWYLIPVGGLRHASTSELVARSLVSLIFAGVGLVGIVRSWLAYAGAKEAKARRSDSEHDV